MQWIYFQFMKIFIIKFFNPRALQTYNFEINISIFQTTGFKSIRQGFMFYFRTWVLPKKFFLYFWSSLTITFGTLAIKARQKIFDIATVLNMIILLSRVSVREFYKRRICCIFLIVVIKLFCIWTFFVREMCFWCFSCIIW